MLTAAVSAKVTAFSSFNWLLLLQLHSLRIYASRRTCCASEKYSSPKSVHHILELRAIDAQMYVIVLKELPVILIAYSYGGILRKAIPLCCPLHNLWWKSWTKVLLSGLSNLSTIPCFLVQVHEGQDGGPAVHLRPGVSGLWERPVCAGMCVRVCDTDCVLVQFSCCSLFWVFSSKYSFFF